MRSLMNTLGSLTQTIQRNPWSSAQDAALLAATLAVGFLLALEYEIVAFWDQLNADQKRIRFEEMLLLTGLLGAGIFAFVLRRLHEERRDREQRLRAELELRESRVLALQDPLTGLPNRRAITAALVQGTPTTGLALFLLDLNGFKRVNDAEGHATGDAVLKAVAQRFRAAARAGDLVARIGGDEFAVLAPDVQRREEAAEIGQRFVAALQSPVMVGNRAYALGVAVGVAFQPQDGVTADELMHSADIAMYSAKATRRSELRFFSQASARAVAQAVPKSA
jgi:diguanylate cyclase (GGDEF)-like protein